MEKPKEWGELLRTFRKRTGRSQDGLVDAFIAFNDDLSSSEKASLRNVGAEAYLTINKSTLSRYETGDIPTQNRGRIILMIYYFRKLKEDAIQPHEADQWLDFLGFAALRDQEYQFIFGKAPRKSTPSRYYAEQFVEFSSEEQEENRAPVLDVPSGASNVVVRREKVGNSFRIVLGFLIPVASLLLLLALLYFNPKAIETLKGLIFSPTTTPTVMPVETPSPAITPVGTDTPSALAMITPTLTLLATQPSTNAPFAVDTAALPAIIPAGNFTFQGTNTSGTRVEIAVSGQQEVNKSEISSSGTWKVEVSLPQAGEYQIDVAEVSEDGITRRNLDPFTVTVSSSVSPVSTTAVPSVDPINVSPAITNPTNVTSSPGNSMFATLAFDQDGVLHLAWMDNTPKNGVGYSILHSLRQPNGTWSNATNLTENFDSVQNTLKFVSRPDGVLCLFWDGATVLTVPSTAGLYLSCYVQGVWTKAEHLQNQPVTATYDLVFAPDGTPHWVYSVPTSAIKVGNSDLADGLKNTALARMAIDSQGGYHVVWRRNGDPVSVEYRYSEDGGQTWSETERLSDDNTPPNSEIWLQADSQGHVHLLWDSGKHSLVYRLWTKEGGWQPIDTQTYSGLVLYPRIALDRADKVHVIWSDNGKVNYVWQQDDGSWTKPLLIGDSQGAEPESAIAVGPDDSLHFVWRTKSDETDYYYGEIP